MILDEEDEDNAVGHVRVVGIETYDLTYSDNDEDWIMFKDPSDDQGGAQFVVLRSWSVVEVRGPTEEDATKLTLFAQSLEKMEQW